MTPIDQFDRNLQAARDLIGLAVSVDSQTSTALDLSDLYRAALVSSVSALDHYVHELVRQKMVDIAAGRRPSTPAYDRFRCTASHVRSAAAGVAPEVWMSDAVRGQHGHLAFQQPDKIADAIRNVWTGSLWSAIALRLGTNAEDLKRSLRLVIDRRNIIVHEADQDPTPPHDRWPMRQTDAESAMALVDSIAHAIDAEVL